jgi:hypothetical protein
VAGKKVWGKNVVDAAFAGAYFSVLLITLSTVIRPQRVVVFGKLCNGVVPGCSVFFHQGEISRQ